MKWKLIVMMMAAGLVLLQDPHGPGYHDLPVYHQHRQEWERVVG